MKKAKPFIIVLCLMILFSSCGLSDKSEALGNYAMDSLKANGVYMGSNETIKSLNKFLRNSDSITDSMKESRLYEIMCDIVANDSFSAYTGSSMQISVRGNKWIFGDVSTDAIFRDTLDTYIIIGSEKKYISYAKLQTAVLATGNVLPNDILQEENELMTGFLTLYAFAFLYDIVDSGTEIIDGREYYYEEIREKTSTYSQWLYYIDGKCIGPVKSSEDIASALWITSAVITEPAIPEGYSPVTSEDIEKYVNELSGQSD